MRDRNKSFTDVLAFRFSARKRFMTGELITPEWVKPVDSMHRLFRAYERSATGPRLVKNDVLVLWQIARRDGSK